MNHDGGKVRNPKFRNSSLTAGTHLTSLILGSQRGCCIPSRIRRRIGRIRSRVVVVVVIIIVPVFGDGGGIGFSSTLPTQSPRRWDRSLIGRAIEPQRCGAIVLVPHFTASAGVNEKLFESTLRRGIVTPLIFVTVV